LYRLLVSGALPRGVLLAVASAALADLDRALGLLAQEPVQRRRGELQVRAPRRADAGLDRPIGDNVRVGQVPQGRPPAGTGLREAPVVGLGAALADQVPAVHLPVV